MFLAFQTPVYAQSPHLSADSITKLLCKKWELDYAIFQGNKIDYPSSKPKVYVEFYKEGTFLMSGDEPGGIEKGSWEYDAAKGTISMILTKEKDRKEILYLTKDQFAIFSDDPARDPNHPERVALKAKVYFKVKKK
jgi:hypothetical protein